MIRVTIWNEFVQENLPDAGEILKVHPAGIHETLRGIFAEDEQLAVTTVTLDMPECGLTEQLLSQTDVLVWWAHVAHDRVPDEIAARVQNHVLRGMGFIALHSAHLCKPLKLLLGTSCTLSWRDGDVCRVWNANPSHPIAQGIPPYIELLDEMYGEFFDIPQPDELVFISWFSGGEVFRSGCCWRRGLGKVFYFQPGHETDRSYYDPNVRRVLKNAAHWATPSARRDTLDCPHATLSPEMKRLEGAGK